MIFQYSLHIISLRRDSSVFLMRQVRQPLNQHGWKDRYRYASCALRFDVNNINEDIDNFKRRINVRRDGDDFERDSGRDRWILERPRIGSSIPIFGRNAADLATCNLIGVYPLLDGERKSHLDDVTSRYVIL